MFSLYFNNNYLKPYYIGHNYSVFNFMMFLVYLEYATSGMDSTKIK